LLKEGSVTPEQVPKVDWDGKKDLVLRAPWIAEDVGAFPSFDDGLRKADKKVSV
jgi:hypothetical protein